MTAAHCVYDDDAEEVPEDTEVEVTFAPDSRDGQNYDQSVTIPYEDIYINPAYGNNGDGEGMCVCGLIYVRDFRRRETTLQPTGPLRL